MKIYHLFIAFIIILSITLSACSPSEEQIQKAISQTQTAQPTSTFTTTPTPTNTEIPTNTPTASNTPSPTLTPKPTATQGKKLSSKEDVILTYSDIQSTVATLAESWKMTPFVVECPFWDQSMDNATGLKKASCYAVTYEPVSYGGFGPLTVQIITFDNVPKGQIIDGPTMAEGFRNYFLAIFADEILTMPKSKNNLPAGSWMVRGGDKYYIGMPYDNTLTIIAYSLSVNDDPKNEVTTELASLSLKMLAYKQREKLKAGGY